jgi:mannose-6-phosphate isomerase-like protein (cupin superfamily)
MSQQIETFRYDENGYKTLVSFEGWRVAFMNDGPKTTIDGLSYFQKHNQSDEVFVLLEGRCVLLMAGFGDTPNEITAVDMEPNVMYNVKKGAWHTHYFAPNTKVIIVENADTDLSSTPCFDITNAQKQVIAELCK